MLGAGRGQIPLILLCQGLGCRVTCVSPKGDYPGFAVADEAFVADVRDKAAVLGYCARNGVDAVLTDQLDLGVSTAAFVSDALGLKGLSPSAAPCFTDKGEMRGAAKAAGVAVPACKLARSFEDAADAARNLEFPLVVKPVDSDASRGVFRVGRMEELRRVFPESLKESRSGRVILEEFVSGDEYVVEALTIDGVSRNLVVGARSYFDIPGMFVPSSTVFSDADSATSHVEEKVKEANLKLLDSFDPGTAITHGEFIYNAAENEVYLVEIAARGGGVFTSSDLVPAACGVDANAVLVGSILGEPDVVIPELTKGAAAYFCFRVPEGTVLRAEGLKEASAVPGVFKAVTESIGEGMRVGPICSKASRKGPFLVKASTKAECREALSQIKERLRIEVETSSGVLGPIWD